MRRARPWALLCALLALTSCGKGDPDVSGGFGEREAREFVLDGAPLAGGLGPKRPTLADLRVQARALAQSDSANGLFLVVEPFNSSLAGAQEAAEIIAIVRKAGNPVHCHFERGDNASYAFMAKSCDRISMSPAGMLNLVGLAAHAFYAHELLTSLGVQAEIIAAGRYKSAGEVLTESAMPAPSREALDALLDDLDAVLRGAIAERFEGDLDEAKARVDGGPYGSSAALAAGLIDAIEYDDESREHLRVAAEVPRVRRVELAPAAATANVFEIIEALSGQKPEEPALGPHLAVVHVDGAIVDGDRQMPGRSVSGPFVAKLRALGDDHSVRAVLLRINSPGGSALASDRMWHAVRMLTRKKPVIVSLGDVAASGGYYIASAGSKIYASDASFVGSIGVIFGKVSFGEVARRVGVEPVILERGAHAAWASPVRPLNDAERAHFRGFIDESYGRFVRRVATGRGRSAEQVRAVAEGRVYSGHAFREHGMVDELGGFDAALRAALSAGKLSANAPIRVWPRAGDLIESIAGALAGGQARTLATQAYGPTLPAPLDYAVDLADRLREAERPLAALPYMLIVR